MLANNDKLLSLCFKLDRSIIWVRYQKPNITEILGISSKINQSSIATADIIQLF